MGLLLSVSCSEDVNRIRPEEVAKATAGSFIADYRVRGQMAACSVWPKAPEFGFPDEMAAFGLQFGHGLGLALHERPIISRLVSLDNPMEIKTGMVFALETYCPATDGFSAARIEEEVVVTDRGCQVITLFPAEELPIANRY